MRHAGPAPRSAAAPALRSAAALALSLGLLAGAATPARAADETDRGPIVLYQVRDGETLTGIARHLLRDGLTWRHLKALNQLDDADRLTPGQELRVPRTWLREETLEARLGQASGDVRVDGSPAEPEARLRAGSTLSTGANGVALVTLPDGTIVRIAPESRVRVERLRRARSTKGIEALFDIEQGEVQVEAPEQRPAGESRRIELRTPKAVAAVRGTRFRVREMPDVATNAVLRGEVAWIGRERERSVQAGFGSSADPSGRTTAPEPLLPAPVIAAPDTPLRTPSADIRFEPVSGAARYRVLVSRDRAALQALGESVLVTNVYTFESPEDGPFFLHVHAVSKTGIDGYGSTARVLVAARPTPPDPGPAQEPVEADEDGQAVLRWPAVADARAYRVQISERRDFDSALLERRVSAGSLTVDLRALTRWPGRWWWRVAGIGQDGEPGPYSEPRALRWQTTAPAVRAEVDLDIPVVRWQPREPAVRTMLRVEPRSTGATPLREYEVGGGEYRIEGLAPGRYEATLRLVYPNGVRSDPGEAAGFTIPLLLRDGSGRPVGSSAGPIRLPES